MLAAHCNRRLSWTLGGCVWSLICLYAAAFTIAQTPDDRSLLTRQPAEGDRLPKFDEDIHSEIDFAQQIVPVLTKAGCNSGACHGAAAGRAYLNLSLYGSRPENDYESLLFASTERFVDLQQPENSWLLMKPSGYLDHGGDVRLDTEGDGYQLIRAWILEGARRGSMEPLAELQISPGNSVECQTGEVVELSARAVWQDGSQRTATQWLVVQGAEPAGAEQAAVSYAMGSDDVLRLTPHIAGYWPVTLRFGPTVKTIQLWVRDPRNEPVAAAVTADMPLTSIDAHVAAANWRIGNGLAEPCEPHLLARRLWLDLLGRHPTLEQWRAATDDIAAGRHSAVVERLLASDAFRLRAAEEVAGWMTASSKRETPLPQLTAAIATALETTDDMRVLARGMLAVDEVDPVAPGLNAFHQLASDPRGRAELVASAWMGVRVGCAQCHDHPLDHWTQDDYFAMAACWSEVEPDGRGVRRVSGRTTTDLRTGRPAIPRLPDDAQPYGQRDLPADAAFVDWLCNDTNEQFAENIANRIWFWLMGTGLIEEVDDHRSTNPAINPALLTHLADSLRRDNFSLTEIVREIVTSDAYARRSQSSATHLAQRLASVRATKPIAHSMQRLASDALELQLSEVEGASGDKTMMMMMEQPEPGCSRAQACSDPLSESLDLAAGSAINDLVVKAVRDAWQRHAEPTELLSEFHQRLFGTMPEAEQIQTWHVWLADAQAGSENGATDLVEDILWSWIVSIDFRVLH